MKYSAQEVIQYVNEEDVKFIRLTFCDVYGSQKNISIMPSELPRAFEYGIAFDASSIDGFGDEKNSNLITNSKVLNNKSLDACKLLYSSSVKYFFNIFPP